MPTRYEVRLSGEGGQGLVLAGKILAEAAAIYDGRNATQSQSYGPEARGGKVQHWIFGVVVGEDRNPIAVPDTVRRQHVGGAIRPPVERRVADAPIADDVRDLGTPVAGVAADDVTEQEHGTPASSRDRRRRGTSGRTGRLPEPHLPAP